MLRLKCGMRRKAISSAIMIALVILSVSAGALSFYAATSIMGPHSNSNQTALNERLGLAVFRVAGGSHNDWLWVEAYNTGGVPVTINAVLVTNSTGGFASLSTTSKSPALVGQPDLNVSLPLTLGVGQNTATMSECGAGLGCGIGINTTAFKHTVGTLFVNVLTARGNDFVAQYTVKSSATTTSALSTSS